MIFRGVSLRYRVKRAVFALVPLAFLLAVATAALGQLERTHTIQLLRRDDIPLHPIGRLVIENDRRGQWIVHNSYAGITAAIEEVKPARELRFAVLGESFAAGSPYVGDEAGPGYGDITSWVSALLQARFPSRSVRGLNEGVGGINSFGLVEMVQTTLNLSPDFLVLIQGNNEGFAGNALSRDLHQWVVYRGMKRALLPEPSMDKRPGAVEPSDEPAVVERNFQENYQTIIEKARRRGVRVVLCTMPLNMAWRGRHAKIPESDWKPDDAIQQGDALFAQGRYTEAMNAYRESREVYFGRLFAARCLEKLGRYDEAMAEYRDLVQRQPMGRARPSFNDYLRELAARNPEVVLADVERAYLNLDPHGMPDERLWVDHCHMVWQGYLTAAREIVRAVIDRGLARGEGEPLPEPRVSALIDQNGWESLRAEAQTRGLSVPD